MYGRHHLRGDWGGWWLIFPVRASRQEVDGLRGSCGLLRCCEHLPLPLTQLYIPPPLSLLLSLSLSLTHDRHAHASILQEQAGQMQGPGLAVQRSREAQGREWESMCEVHQPTDLGPHTASA